MNAANEVAVQAFLDGEIPFPAITDVVSEVVATQARHEAAVLGDVLAADQAAREQARRACAMARISTP
jgi:1-deoxy-D-xylulose-5-phosphate reductoisomerase